MYFPSVSEQIDIDVNNSCNLKMPTEKIQATSLSTFCVLHLKKFLHDCSTILPIKSYFRLYEIMCHCSYKRTQMPDDEWKQRNYWTCYSNENAVLKLSFTLYLHVMKHDLSIKLVIGMISA